MITRALTRPTGLLPGLFENFFNPFDEMIGTGALRNRTWNVPAVNVRESDDEFELALAVPGMNKDDFQIDIDGNILTVSAEMEEENEEEDEEYTRQEYNYTSFRRSFTLPEEVNKERIEAEYVDGVLNLILPKKEEAKKALNIKHVTVK